MEISLRIKAHLEAATERALSAEEPITEARAQQIRQRISELEPLLQEYLPTVGQPPPERLPATLDILEELCQGHGRLAQLRQAKAYGQRMFGLARAAGRRREEGRALNDLALVEKDLGNLSGARALLQRAIAIAEKAFEPDHPTLATSYSNLAVVERGLGNPSEARALLQRAIAIKKKAFEPDHPTLATSYSNQALVEEDLGNLSEARTLLQRAIAIGEKAFEPDHPSLATSYNNLAFVEADLGNWDAARELMRRAYGIWRARLGGEHPSTQASRRWLAAHDPRFAEDAPGEGE